jgi:hypothetical protein
VSTETVQTEPEVMIGAFNVHSTPTTILFYYGASHTFISNIFVRMHSVPMLAMKEPLLENSPGGTIQTTNRCLPVSMVLRGVEFKITPIVLRTSGIDVILGMDWMKQNQAVIQCQQKVVVVNTPNGEKISVDVAVQKQPAAVVNQLHEDARKEDPVINDFPDVFLDDLPGMPPDRDIEFLIELLPRTTPIAKRPYRMGVDELEELKKQIKELQDKGFIRPSSSPWGAPVIFVDKKNGGQRMCVDYRSLMK